MDRMSPDGIVDDVDQGSMEAGSGQYVLQMGIRSMDQASSGMSNNSGMSWQQQRRPMQHITGFYGDFDPPGMLQQQQQYSRSGCFNVMQDMVMMSGSFEGDVPGVQIPSGPRFWPNGGGGADGMVL